MYQLSDFSGSPERECTFTDIGIKFSYFKITTFASFCLLNPILHIIASFTYIPIQRVLLKEVPATLNVVTIKSCLFVTFHHSRSTLILRRFQEIRVNVHFQKR